MADRPFKVGDVVVVAVADATLGPCQTHCDQGTVAIITGFLQTSDDDTAYDLWDATIPATGKTDARFYTKELAHPEDLTDG